MTVSPRTGRFSAQRRLDYRRLTGVFDAYVRAGRVDLSVRGRGGGGARPPQTPGGGVGARGGAGRGRPGGGPGPPPPPRAGRGGGPARAWHHARATPRGSPGR